MTLVLRNYGRRICLICIETLLRWYEFKNLFLHSSEYLNVNSWRCGGPGFSHKQGCCDFVQPKKPGLVFSKFQL